MSEITSSTGLAAAPAAGAGDITIHIRPRRGWIGLEWNELWRYRELLWLLTLRDIKGRYRQTVLGPTWAIIQPIMTVVVFNVVFGLLLGRDGVPTVPGVPYAISTFTALIAWQLFTKALTRASGSMVAAQTVITKVYYPRLINPLATTVGSLVDFAIAFSVLIVMMAGYHIFSDAYDFVPTAALLMVPVLIVLTVFIALSLALWFASLNAVVRDVGQGLPFLIQIGMYMTPVIYTTNSILINDAGEPRVSELVRFIYCMNPMVGIAEGFRWSLLGGPPPEWVPFMISMVIVAILFAGGLQFFRRMERVIVDVV